MSDELFNNIKKAFERMNGIINNTPIITSSTLNKKTQSNCFLKCENFQKTGSFKIRGSFNAISQLTSDQKSKGVITHSSGNHAQALAFAAKLFNIKALVVMPNITPTIKVAATRGYGAEIVFCGPSLSDREKTVIPLIQKYGYTLVHSSNNLKVIAGAGTVAYELINEVGKLDYIFCPVGGGGLLSGTVIATKHLLPNAKVIGVEPKNADDAYTSLREKRIIRVKKPNTIADGLRTSLGSHTFKIISEKINQIITVTEEEIVDAMQFLWERMKMVVEPSGAVSLAGVLSKKIDLSSKRIGIIISGGNIDLTDFFIEIKKRISIK
jgi:threonine dehydratase